MGRGAAVVAHLLVRVHVWTVDHGREKPAEYWFPGPVRSALRVLRAVKNLSWDEFVYARLLEEWTGVLVHQSARTACLTIVGMTAPVLGSVLIGKQGPIKRGCAYACRALAGGGHPVFVDKGDPGAGSFQVYYAARNQFERFRGFLELISRFEFEFCRCENYIF